MQERDTYEHIRKTLLNAEVQAPNFNDLFGEETLGVDPLRTIFSSKLANHTAQAPDFDQLFAGEIVVKTKKALKIRMLPLWSIAGVAAACLAVLFLLPKQIVNPVKDLSVAPITEKSPSSIKRTIKAHNNVLPFLKAQMLASPSNIKPLKVEPKNTSVSAAMAIISEQTSTTENVERDSTSTETLTKIKPTRSSGLPIKSARTIEEAYADARIKKSKLKPDKMTVGFGMNSTSRLLSMVNSKTDGGFALQSVANSTTTGYASLEGASATKLRASTASPNEWIKPENITSLQNCETNYSLPINLGLTVSIPIIHDLNLVTGLQYTYMANKITGKTFDLKQELHYLGIPVKIAVNLVKRGDFIIYSALGGTVEKGLSGIQTSNVDGEAEWKGTQKIEGIQTSLTGQFGVSYNLNKSFLIYLEPGVAWYIPNDQPISSRTEEPFNFNLALGLRYRLQ